MGLEILIPVGDAAFRMSMALETASRAARAVSGLGLPRGTLLVRTDKGVVRLNIPLTEEEACFLAIREGDGRVDFGGSGVRERMWILSNPETRKGMDAHPFRWDDTAWTDFSALVSSASRQSRERSERAAMAVRTFSRLLPLISEAAGGMERAEIGGMEMKVL